MRQMMEEFEEKPQEKTEISRLDMHGLSRKEKRAIIRERLKEETEGMTDKEKYKYLAYYYKEAIIITIGVIACLIFLISTIYKITRPITISYAVVNCHDKLDLDTDVIKEYAKAIGKYRGHQVKGDANINLQTDAQEYVDDSNNQIYVNFMNMITSDYYDVVFTDGKGATYLAKEGLINPVNEYLDADLYNKVKGDVKTFNGSNGQPFEAVVDISGTDIAKRMNFGYTDVYICFPGNQERNHEAVNDLLGYLYQ
ncbi:MAG: hypothetical protein J5517_04465 [Eubacterium sp.]|nr:hypothetical protein [Eubacterium sp.]